MIRTVPYLGALCTILVATFLFQVVAHEPTVPMQKDLQSSFPLRLGLWEGETEFTEPGILANLRVDDYLLRRYRPPSGKALWLYVGYWGSQPLGTRVHSPIVCLPGAGWVIADSGTIRLRVANRAITINRDLVEKGEQKQVVLYWYQIHGRVAARELQAISFVAWTALTRRRSDEALIRINAPVVDTIEETLQRERAFIQAAFPPLDRFLPR